MIMLHVPGGRFVRGEVSSADASAGVAVSLYDMEGNAVTLGSTERLVIYDLAIIAVAGGAIALTQITNVAGKRLVSGTVAANGGIVIDYLRPLECAKGQTPVLFAAAGQVNLSLVAEILSV
jgi:hypothetical protein